MVNFKTVVWLDHIISINIQQILILLRLQTMVVRIWASLWFLISKNKPDYLSGGSSVFPFQFYLLNLPASTLWFFCFIFIIFFFFITFFSFVIMKISFTTFRHSPMPISIFFKSLCSRFIHFLRIFIKCHKLLQT